MAVKYLWGNSNYSYVSSDSLGNSGGIICVWEKSMFRKENVTISDNFIAIYGTWIPYGLKVLFIVIYAPQQLSAKNLLWDYVSSLINNWSGEAIVMGDFNEVRCNEERYGSSFNTLGARRFNEFIMSAGLVDINLEGYKFTWSHPSASKMSKLDRFLVTEDSNRNWFVSRNATRVEFLNRAGVKERKQIYVEAGDENSRYFHGIINKKRSQLAIRGVFNNGIWYTEPAIVKDIFKNHFQTRFDQPQQPRFKINFQFDKCLSVDQVMDLDSMISREEIRRAVWSCGVDKSPGPDGFSFEFFRKYWSFIGTDFCGAVEHFFSKDIISDTQSAFLAKRNILDGPFILNELLSWCKKYNKQAMFFKVDFAKAFDCVRWDYLLDVMKSFGFGPNWCRWIQDDAMFIGEWSQANLENVIKMLQCFQAASGLSINIQKSNLLGVGVGRSEIDQAADNIGCLVMNNRFRYLGVMVGDLMNRKAAWVEVINKLRARLSNWKVKTLSIGGRYTLLKSVLGSSPLYHMSIFKTPKGVLKEMEGIRSKFFNGNDPKERKITWVAWQKVLASKVQGGLGVSSFFALNRALLIKWYWRFLSNDGSLWSHVIQAIHGDKLDHVSNSPSLWSTILREINSLKDIGFDFMSHCKKRIGNGRATKFWTDKWVLDVTFRERFPRVYALDMDKECLVASKFGGGQISDSFRRNVRDGAETSKQMEAFFCFGECLSYA
ncbi:RNA-directed DNA polymerase, eukaryota [Tanacetum coccineum]